METAIQSSKQNYLGPQYCLHSKGHVFDISTRPFPASYMKDFIVAVFNMQFIMCTFTANGQVLLNSGFGVIVVVYCMRHTYTVQA